MCGRYSLAIPKPEVLQQRFDAQAIEGVEARFNAAPGQALPVVTRHSPNRLEWMTWGLIPFWAKDDKGRYSMINARAEGIESKPAFRKPLRSQRCLVPATGFYEWDKSVKPSVPYHFQVVDLDLFAFAGLYDEWQDRDTGETRRTYTIITTAANEVVAPVHNRMPVVLTPEAEAIWLDPDETDPLHLLPLLQPFPAERMRAYVVSTAVNNVRNDMPTLIEPVASP
jgi:putative SOS response-associated peptidase YedK